MPGHRRFPESRTPRNSPACDMARPLLVSLRQVRPQQGWGCGQADQRARRAPGGAAMMTMDFWYDLASRGPGDLNEQATHLLREAEEVLRLPRSEDADEDDQ